MKKEKVKEIIEIIEILEKKSAIEHFQKLITCDDFIVTGSFVLQMQGLVPFCKDLDIILTNPDDKSMVILNKLKIPHDNKDYPEDPTHIRVKFEKIMVDFFTNSEFKKYIILENGLKVSPVMDIINAKQKYTSFKQALQLKNMADMIMPKDRFDSAIFKELKKYK